MCILDELFRSVQSHNIGRDANDYVWDFDLTTSRIEGLDVLAWKAMIVHRNGDRARDYRAVRVDLADAVRDVLRLFDDGEGGTDT